MLETSAVPFQSALLVEDEQDLSLALKIALRKLGIACTHASTLKQAREELERTPADFILLDRALPDGDGVELCARLRAEGFHGCILMLTAKGDAQSRVEGLNQGADDYLAKPFSWEELEARIHALGRRRAFSNAAALATPAQPSAGVPATGCPPALIKGWELDGDRLRIRKPAAEPDAKWVVLTPLEFKLASRLIEADGAILTREDLLKNVWGFKFLPKTRTVDHFLGRLRKHFEPDAEVPRHFITVRGAGYRFEA